MPVAVDRGGAGARRSGGRPRDPRVDEAVLAAALEVLAEDGYARLTIEGVAQRAGVARTSVYRRWPTKASLVLDAVIKLGLAEGPQVPDTGSLHGDMSTYMGAWVRFRGAQAWTGALLADAELKHLVRKQLGGGLTSGYRTIVERAVARGELPPQTDIDLLATLPMALVHQHFALTGRPADEGLVRRIADQFFRPASRPGPSVGGSR